MEPVQGLNLNRRYLSGLEPAIPVTIYFVNLYMFQAYLGPSSGGTTVCMQQLVLITSTNCSIHTVVPPDDGPRYARNMEKLTKYTKNKL